ncbi:GNAT family N-acetyltransferase [Massilia sp. Leaf139]|uniref:GNAT family N-acetyltransferase n=1 Tax=Massilia sp. Leaf139 TaxID=1736272 RepID=UPI0006F7425E|nr:GNAT family N-acetyltransferase [Massilia sp. Leaf139]KQQ87011.1 acetyltransferase [Massilia sp. Leaf139]
MSLSQERDVSFKFQLSDWTLFQTSIRLQPCSIGLAEAGNPAAIAIPGEDQLAPGSQGFALRRLPVDETLPRLARSGPFLRYVPLHYQHCYIDLNTSFEDYQKKFSSKTRSTINRKIRKFTEHCGGTLKWHSYRKPDEVPAFFQLARAVSKLTYQEKLLDAGLPDTPEFMERARALAASGHLRAYVLFDGDKPVSYLYCPVQDGVAIYSYLGYDPAYMHLSVGTVLQWLALEEMFNEGGLRYFDFTEGQSDHKRLFATHQRQCANVFLVRPTLRNAAILRGHAMMDRFSVWTGQLLDRYGVKAKVRRLIRRHG